MKFMHRQDIRRIERKGKKEYVPDGKVRTRDGILVSYRTYIDGKKEEKNRADD